MRNRRFAALAALLLAGAFISVVAAKTSGFKTSGPETPEANAAELKGSESGSFHRSVVVELFTSEGCSSCPPADALLGHLRQDLAARNIQVIPLGFHVDYWNSLGWKDRFSSADYSQRQEQYARSLKVDGPYTPQMVVDGEAEFVGSNASQAQRAISEAAGKPELAEVKIEKAGADQLSVRVKGPTSAGDAKVMLALTEDNLATQVGSGENGGRTLHHAAVVRELRQLGGLRSGSFEASVPLTVGKDWKRPDVRAVVFVQEASSGKILGSASVALTD
ncbi:MAG TPA: DUF1223 domain-containing protein [Candidatus Angelobacter sp.]|jgi:hypothetical protein